MPSMLVRPIMYQSIDIITIITIGSMISQSMPSRTLLERDLKSLMMSAAITLACLRAPEANCCQKPIGPCREMWVIA